MQLVGDAQGVAERGKEGKGFLLFGNSQMDRRMSMMRSALECWSVGVGLELGQG